MSKHVDDIAIPAGAKSGRKQAAKGEKKHNLNGNSQANEIQELMFVKVCSST